MVRLKEFFDACKNGDLGIVLAFIGSCKNKNALIQRLSGPGLDSVENNEYAGIHLAALHNHIDCVKALVNAGCNIYAQDKTGCTGLHYAAWNGNGEMASLLLTADALHRKQLANVANSDGSTPLHVACERCSTEVAEYLLEFGANPLTHNRQGISSFDLACQFGHVDIVKLLLVPCQDLQRMAWFTHGSPLEQAAKGGHEAVVTTLLDAGFSVNARSSQGTPLHAACLGLRRHIVELLLSNGANWRLRNQRGETVPELLQSLASPEHTKLREEFFPDACDSVKSRKAPPRPPPPSSTSLRISRPPTSTAESSETPAPPQPTPRKSQMLTHQQPPVAKRRTSHLAQKIPNVQQEETRQPPPPKPRNRALPQPDTQQSSLPEEPPLIDFGAEPVDSQLPDSQQQQHEQQQQQVESTGLLLDFGQPDPGRDSPVVQHPAEGLLIQLDDCDEQPPAKGEAASESANQVAACQSANEDEECEHPEWRPISIPPREVSVGMVEEANRLGMSQQPNGPQMLPEPETVSESVFYVK